MDQPLNFEDTQVASIKNKLIDTLLTIYSILCTPLLLFSLSRLSITDWSAAYYFQIIIVVLFLTMSFFRKKLNYKIKAITTSIILFVLFTTGIHTFGLLTSGIVYMLLLALFTSLFFGKKYGYISLLIVVVIFILYGISYNYGMLNYRFDTNKMLSSRILWISIGLTFTTASYTTILIVTRLESAYKTMLKQSLKNEAEYKLLFDQATEGVVITNMKGNILLANENFKIMSGYELDSVIGKNLTDFLLPEDQLNNPIRFNLIVKGETVKSERRVIDKHGNIRFIQIKSNQLPDGRLQSLIRDITEQKNYETTIEAERSFGKKLIETLPGIFYVFENYDKLVRWNDSLQLASGYSAEELQKIHPNILFDSGNHENVGESIIQSNAEGSAFFKTDLITKSGERIPLYNSAVTYSSEGKLYVMGMGYDITELINTEKALKNSEVNFRNIYNNTSDAIFIFNHNFEILSANQRFFSLTGLIEEDLKDVNIFDFIFDQNTLRKVATEIDQVDKGRVVIAEYMIKDLAGRSFPIEVRSRQIVYQGQPAVITTFNDISARKDIEKQIYTVSVKAEEDERGRIAKDLHDGLGPLLSTCKIYLHNIKGTGFNEKEYRSYQKLSELINESLTGVKEISNNLSPHILRNFGLAHALKSFIEKLTVFSEIKIKTALKASNRYDEITEITLYRVATELLNNTLKHAKAHHIVLEIKESDHKLIMHYTDDGIGFEYEKFRKINSGLGLFNINSRINSIGGMLIFKSAKGHGVNVTIETNI